MRDAPGDDGGELVELITKNQDKLYAYIVSLLYRQQDSHDVLQETNMVLWKKRREAPKSEEFIAWACRVAYFQVLAYRKRNQRDRLFFAEGLLSELSVNATEGLGAHDSRVRALSGCLQRLPEESLELVRLRYFSSMSVTDLSQKLSKSAAAISQSLYRIRKQLMDCVHRREAKGA